MNGNSLV